MRLRTKTAAALASLALIAGAALAADSKPMANKDTKPAAPANAGTMGMSEADMQAMMKAAMPGPQHQHLAKMAGDWTFTNTFWMGPGAPPQTSTGTMHADAVLGGRYVEHHWMGSMMGQPFEGHGTEGYDNVSKQWVTTWIDNMGTGMMNGSGTCNDTMSTCTYMSKMWDPTTGKETSMKSVITWVNDNEFHNEMYGPAPDGKEMKMMEIVAKRKMM